MSERAVDWRARGREVGGWLRFTGFVVLVGLTTDHVWAMRVLLLWMWLRLDHADEKCRRLTNQGDSRR